MEAATGEIRIPAAHLTGDVATRARDFGRAPAHYTPDTLSTDETASMEPVGTPSVLYALASAVIIGILAFFVFDPMGIFGFGGTGGASGASGGNTGAGGGVAHAGWVLPTPAHDPSQIPTIVEPEAGDVTIEVMMIGDILAHDRVIESGRRADGSYNYDHIFAHITDELAMSDLRIVNQETMAGGAERGFAMGEGDNGPRFNSPTELMDASAAAGFNVVLKAHNHTYDQGYDGLANELAFWRSSHPEVAVLGVRDPSDPGAHNWVDDTFIFEKEGFRVAVLNWTFGVNEFPDWEHYHTYAAPLTESQVRADVARARERGADMIIACPHWGTEYNTGTTESQEYFANLFCELGVDVVFGTHPHILEPARVMVNGEGHETVVFFSNGNFIASDMPTTSQIAAISRVTLVQHPDGSCYVSRASMIPVVASAAPGTACSSWPLYDYTNEICYASWREDLNVDLVQNFCSEVLGEAYNRETCEYVVKGEGYRS